MIQPGQALYDLTAIILSNFDDNNLLVAALVYDVNKKKWTLYNQNFGFIIEHTAIQDFAHFGACSILFLENNECKPHVLYPERLIYTRRL